MILRWNGAIYTREPSFDERMEIERAIAEDLEFLSWSREKFIDQKTVDGRILGFDSIDDC